ncbi:hypothetical protein CAMRE0001_1296 [Campylobacter rectus RM3267]|uniref:Uncharacterized protein n=1 Tax=Campylobacter rectus RM3267 TaxID=553218 RepID=B9CZY8_CAMRE|nr:hypothetical protein CAMRE0001_1296 [Campylobacter rectus RM3267]
MISPRLSLFWLCPLVWERYFKLDLDKFSVLRPIALRSAVYLA